MWDALVIGAGPAGSVTARELARRGRRVLLVDRAAFPRAKVCGCCLNGAAIRTLRRAGLGHVLDDAVPLRSVILACGKRRAELVLPCGVALSRDALDLRLVREATEAGVEFRPGINVSHNTDLLVRSRVTIVATGLAGGEARPELGSRIGAGLVLSQEAAPPFYRPHAIHMAVGRGGYVGLVRVEDGRLDVAAAFDASFVRTVGGPGPAAAAVLRGVAWPVPQELAGAPWRGTPALSRRPGRVAGDRVFRVGDAAGYVEPFTGEGMGWAVMSAVALAPIAARAAHGWDETLAHEWEATHRRLIGPRRRACRIVARALRSPSLTSLGIRFLAIAPVLARPVIAALNRPSVHGTAP